MSGNCIGERTGAKLSCKLAYSLEGIPKSPFMSTVVVILVVSHVGIEGIEAVKFAPGVLGVEPPVNGGSGGISLRDQGWTSRRRAKNPRRRLAGTARSSAGGDPQR